MDVVVIGVPLLQSLSVELDGEAVAVLANTVSRGMVKLQDPFVNEFRVIRVRSVATAALMSLGERDTGDQNNQQGKGELSFHS